VLQLEDHVVRTIAHDGPAYGVHVLATCTRWGDIRMNMRDSFEVKLELADGTESAINRGMA
jgi:S-DNA-T family DNA segregation ATPase FtsK/SpoIIIE